MTSHNIAQQPTSGRLGEQNMPRARVVAAAGVVQASSSPCCQAPVVATFTSVRCDRCRGPVTAARWAGVTA